MRHGSAEPLSWGGEDFQRALTPVGIKEVSQTGKQFLEQFSWLPERVLCSDARRTQQTFEFINKVLNLQLGVEFCTSFYSGGPHEILNEIEKTKDNIQGLLIIGHNPTLSDLTTQLSGGIVSLNPANGVILEKNSPSWAQAIHEQGWSMSKLLSGQ